MGSNGSGMKTKEIQTDSDGESNTLSTNGAPSFVKVKKQLSEIAAKRTFSDRGGNELPRSKPILHIKTEGEQSDIVVSGEEENIDQGYLNQIAAKDISAKLYPSKNSLLKI
jgi:hypothetical protein